MDDARYRRDEHCSSVVAVEKKQQMDMIRHDDEIVYMNRRIYIFDILDGFLCNVTVFCQNDIRRTTDGRPYGETLDNSGFLSLVQNVRKYAPFEL